MFNFTLQCLYPFTDTTVSFKYNLGPGRGRSRDYKVLPESDHDWSICGQLVQLNAFVLNQAGS